MTTTANEQIQMSIALDHKKMEQMLNERRLVGASPWTGQNVQLFDPEGEADVIVSRRFADLFCDSHPGWSWKAV